MWHNKEASLLFSSGFVANEAALNALGTLIPDIVMISDVDNHASMIAGIRNSKCEKRLYRHNDISHLEEILQSLPYSRPKIIIFESIYSMDGSMAYVSDICDLAYRYNALTYLDEVHAVGMYGEYGSGVAEMLGERHRIDFINGTLAKAVGVFGGYVASSKVMIDMIRSKAPGFIFTSAIPPSVAAGATASIRYLKYAQEERITQQLRASQLKHMLIESNLDVLPNVSHIVPLLVKDPRKCKALSDILLQEHGVYMQPINYPTVPRGTERLRITPGPQHSYSDLIELTQAINTAWDKLSLPRRNASIHTGMHQSHTGIEHPQLFQEHLISHTIQQQYKSHISQTV